MEHTGQYLQVLLFVANKEQADGDSAAAGEGPVGAPPSPPLRRDRIILYALLPRIDRFDALAKLFGKNGVIVLTSEKLSAFLLNSARIGRVELVEMFVRVGHHLVDSAGRLIVSTDPFNLDILPVLLAQHIVDESLYPGIVPSSMRLPLDDEINFNILKTLVAAGPDIKHRHEEGGTLLHFAVRENHQKLVALLVESGAQVDAKTNRGNTPLHLALDTYPPSTEILTCLLESGANVNVAGEDNVTPFLKAIKELGYAYRDIIGQFLDKGGDVNSASHFGSALKLAAEGGQHLLSQVLSRGPDLEKNKQAFREILKKPGRRHHSEAVKQLLDYGFKLFPEDAVDDELLNVVLLLNDRKMFEDLLRWGAVVHRKPRWRRRSRRQRAPPPSAVEQPDLIKDLLLRAMRRSDTDSMKYLLEIDDIRENSFYSDILRELACDINTDTISFFLEMSDLRLSSIFDSKLIQSLEPEELPEPDEEVVDYDLYIDRQIELENENEEKAYIRNVICCHSVIIAAAELRVNKGFSLNGQEFRKDALPDWVQESVPSEFLGECISEVERLKAERVGVSSYTFHDVLNFTLCEAVRLLRNPIARDTWKSSDHFAASFPNYWPLIDFRLRRADYRRTLIDQGTKVFGFLSQHCRQLPFELREHIVQNLCNHELLILIDVCTLAAGKAATAATSQSQEIKRN